MKRAKLRHGPENVGLADKMGSKLRLGDENVGEADNMGVKL